MSEWQSKALSEIADIRVSNVDKKSISGEQAVLLCNYMDVYSNEYITRDLDFMQATANAVEVEKFKVQNGDVIITKDSETPYDIGIPAMAIDATEYLICGYHLALLKPNPAVVDSVFLSKQLAHPQTARYFSRYAAGSTRYGLSNKSIAQTIVSLPPIEQQQKIARILQTIDRAIEQTEALIDKYQQIKSGLMHDLFTRGIGLDGQLRPPREQAPHLYQKTPIGWIPQEWEVMAVQDAFDITSGITLGGHRRPRNHPRPYLRVANVFKEKIDLRDISFLEATDEENARYGLRTLDLLLVEGHANIQQIGRCAMVCDNAEGMLFQNHLFRLKALELSSYYGMYFLNSQHARKYWEMNCSTSSGLNTINRRMLGNMAICVPSKKEQFKIEIKLNSTHEFINNEMKFLEKLKKQKSGLMHDLLAGKVLVQPDPEPAHG